MAQVGQAMQAMAANNPEYLMRDPRHISRWVTFTKRMFDSKESTGPRFTIEKHRVLEFGDGYVLIKPEYFHPSQNSTGPYKEFVTETAEEILKLMD